MSMEARGWPSDGIYEVQPMWELGEHLSEHDFSIGSSSSHLIHEELSTRFHEHEMSHKHDTGSENQSNHPDKVDWNSLQGASDPGASPSEDIDLSLSPTDWNHLADFLHPDEASQEIVTAEDEDSENNNWDPMSYLNLDEVDNFEEPNHSDDVHSSHGNIYKVKKTRIRKSRPKDIMTPFWISLQTKMKAKKKRDIVTSYAEMTMYQGKPIHRALAARRLSLRCTEKLGDDLLSSDYQIRLIAKHQIDAACVRGCRQESGFLTVPEKAILVDIIKSNYGKHNRKTASTIINNGFNALSNERRAEITAVLPKDATYMSTLAKEIYTSYIKTRCKFDKSFIVQEENELSYWMSLPKEKQEAIIQKYMEATDATFDQAWSKMDVRCSRKLASALLSNEVEYALTVFGKVYRRKQDIFTVEERELFEKELQNGIHLASRDQPTRVLSMALKKMSEEEKRDIREDIRMDKSRFIPLTKTIVNYFKIARREEKREWIRKIQQERAEAEAEAEARIRQTL